MTTRVHCQACLRSQPLRTDEAAVKREGWRPFIVAVAYTDADGRTHTADLCPICEAALLGRYFGVEANGRVSDAAAEWAALAGPPEMPDFLEADAASSPS